MNSTRHFVGPAGSRGIGRHHQNGSRPSTLLPPPQNFPSTSRLPPHKTCHQGETGPVQETWTILTQTPYKGMGSYCPRPISPVICLIPITLSRHTAPYPSPAKKATCPPLTGTSLLSPSPVGPKPCRRARPIKSLFRLTFAGPLYSISLPIRLNLRHFISAIHVLVLYLS